MELRDSELEHQSMLTALFGRSDMEWEMDDTLQRSILSEQFDTS